MKWLLGLVLLLCSCDGTIPHPEEQKPVIPLGQTCDPKQTTDYVTGCYVCPVAGFYECCRQRPEKFACSCMLLRQEYIWLAGFCSI